MTRRPRSVLWLLAGLATVVVSGATGCSVEQTLPPPDCDEGGSALIVAQSVPSASEIPCLFDLPAGWSVSTVRINETHTVVTFDSDRAGEAAAVMRLESECDITEAVRVPSEQPSARRFDAIQQLEPSFLADRFYVFPGGCVWWRFDFDRGASSSESVEIGGAFTLVSRADFQRQVSEQFIDEEI